MAQVQQEGRRETCIPHHHLSSYLLTALRARSRAREVAVKQLLARKVLLGLSLGVPPGILGRNLGAPGSGKRMSRHHARKSVCGVEVPVGGDPHRAPAPHWPAFPHNPPSLFPSQAQKTEVLPPSSWLFLTLRQRHPTRVLLPGKSHGRRSLVGCSPWGH